MSTDIFDRRLLHIRRERAARTIDGHEFLLTRAEDDLIERLEGIRREFPVALIVGTHHDRLAAVPADRPGTVLVISADLAETMVARCPSPRLVADEEALPFGAGTLDLVVSVLVLQSVNDLPGALVQIRRALKPDGLLLAALLGGATLTELRTALMIAEEETAGGISPRVAPFADVRDLGGLLVRADFALPVVDTDRVRVTYPDLLALMHDLRGMGLTNVLRHTRRGPLKRATLVRAAEVYRERFGLAGGRIPATFEILTLTGWAPHPDQPRALRPGTAHARLADALGTEEQPSGDAVPVPKKDG